MWPLLILAHSLLLGLDLCYCLAIHIGYITLLKKQGSLPIHRTLYVGETVNHMPLESMTGKQDKTQPIFTKTSLSLTLYTS